MGLTDPTQWHESARWVVEQPHTCSATELSALSHSTNQVGVELGTDLQTFLSSLSSWSAPLGIVDAVHLISGGCSWGRVCRDHQQAI